MLRAVRLCRETCVVKNDRLGDDPAAYDRIIVSPGPGTPSEAGKLLSFTERCAPVRPLLGVCLGHHAIAWLLAAAPEYATGLARHLFVGGSSLPVSRILFTRPDSGRTVSFVDSGRGWDSRLSRSDGPDAGYRARPPIGW